MKKCIWFLAVCALFASGCDEDPAPARSSRPSSQSGTADASGSERTRYIASSVVFDADSEQTYVSVLDSLDSQEIDYASAREFAGWSDVWIHEGAVYVSSREEHTVTKFSIEDDNTLIEEAQISFAKYGEVDVAFWSNTFVAPDKAYMIEGTRGYVIWDPQTMEITGTFDLPNLPEREGLLVRAGTLDRANVIRDGKLYQPMYWSDEDYARFAPDSRVAVIDITTDRVIETIDAPCAGLDIGSADDEGNLYFSTWTSGVFQPLWDKGSPNCVATIPASEESARVAFKFADVTEGREGSAVRNFRDGKLLFSVFHQERVDLTDADADPFELLGERNWRTWLYDPETSSASAVEGLDWNSGATYVFDIDDVHYVMVPSTNYEATSVVALEDDLTTSTRFEMRGWATRLFAVE
jgi:hypothetical protein